MASITIAPSFLGGSAAATTKQLPATARRGVVMVRASMESEKIMVKAKEESINNRRGLMFAMAAVAVCSVSGVAMADEPKRGTEAAKKKYAPVCVTMPTARICRN